MSVCVVWIDSQEAKLFSFSEDRMERETVRSVGRPDHHTHSQRETLEDQTQLYDQVAAKLGDARSILILGPGLTRKDLHKRLLERHPRLGARVVGCEASDHPSNQQIAAFAMKYFRKPVA
jgi:hypothetical protein